MMMRALDRRAFIVALSAAGLSGADAFAQSATATLDGTWEGLLDTISGPGIAPPPEGEFPPIRLQIDGLNVRVFFGGAEVKAGTFEIRRAGTNAVISSIQPDPSLPLGRSWVETWTFTVTLADADTLVVNYVRVVNNNGLPRTADRAQFSQIRTGQFRRVQTDHV
jgi:hypothetical protein